MTEFDRAIRRAPKRPDPNRTPMLGQTWMIVLTALFIIGCILVLIFADKAVSQAAFDAANFEPLTF